MARAAGGLPNKLSRQRREVLRQLVSFSIGERGCRFGDLTLRYEVEAAEGLVVPALNGGVDPDPQGIMAIRFVVHDDHVPRRTVEARSKQPANDVRVLDVKAVETSGMTGWGVAIALGEAVREQRAPISHSAPRGLVDRQARRTSGEAAACPWRLLRLGRGRVDGAFLESFEVRSTGGVRLVALIEAGRRLVDPDAVPTLERSDEDRHVERPCLRWMPRLEHEEMDEGLKQQWAKHVSIVVFARAARDHSRRLIAATHADRDFRILPRARDPRSRPARSMSQTGTGSSPRRRS